MFHVLLVKKLQLMDKKNYSPKGDQMLFIMKDLHWQEVIIM